MIQRIYIDTSVIGGCFDNEFSKWSIKFFDEIKSGNIIALVSDLMLEEIENAPINVRDLFLTLPHSNIETLLKDNETENLAGLYIYEKAVTKKFYQDALHIAIATVNKADVLVSWNFKHIVNLERIRKYNAVNLKNGYHFLEIRTPREVLYEK
jgi:predicted nucleic acid-binding protein